MSRRMSADFHSSNPFRQKATASSRPLEDDLPQAHDAYAPTPSHAQEPNSITIGQSAVQVKPIKKVRVQSPPPSSPEGDSIPQKPPTPIPRYDDQPIAEDDPFEQPTSDPSDGSDDETETVKTTYVPLNPFQKTLATLERTDEKPYNVAQPTVVSSSAGRASLDVEAFKRLLMTGSADSVPPVTTTSPAINISHLGVHDGGSSTDASSSASRQSIFEPIQEIHPESPRTSHEVSDPDDERRRFTNDGVASSDRRKPPPPSSRHGKLIRVELRDEGSIKLDIPSLPGPNRGLQNPMTSPSSLQSSRSPTDLNKPLPAAPTRASHESDRDSIFDKEAAGKTPEPPSPSLSMNRKVPPAPPLSRRHSQLVPDSKIIRSSTIRLPPNKEEDRVDLESRNFAIAQANMTKPPPPPTRRPASIRNSSTQDSVTSSASSFPEQERPASVSGSAPTPPPARRQSMRQSGRPASVLSIDLSNKRTSFAPPPPPPPRQRASSRASTEARVLSTSSSRRASSDMYRRSIDSASNDSPAAQSALTEGPRGSYGANNILADLTALQREVDALRGQYEMRDVT